VKHRRRACGAYLEAAQRLVLPTERVPQLFEVDYKLRSLTGFRVASVPGLVPTRRFYGASAERRFLSTQYIRHHSVPFCTPESDIVHEIIGHANMLAGERFASLYQAAGEASRRASGDAAHEFFSKVFWFILEFGVVHEDGDLKSYGAGLLSSYGGIDEFHLAQIRPFDISEMGTTQYDIIRCQPVLFAASSFGEMYGELLEFFSGYGDDAYRRPVAA